MKIVVQKFGGSSVGDAERIRRVARRVIERRAEGYSVVVVVSARGDTTDELLALANEITSDPPVRELDMLLATGEQISIALLAMAIKAMGNEVISLTGGQAGIHTDGVYNKARISSVKSERLIRELQEGRIAIVAGFQGVSQEQEITTLGRGGSDTTAVALAAALKAQRCEIFTDVDGVFTADPRLVPEARKLEQISYDEMLELASLGAQVLQPRAVEFAKQFQVPLEVRSSFNYSNGTLVQEVAGMEKAMLVSGVAHDRNVAKITIYDVPDQPGIAYRIFNALASAKINVDMIIQSATRNGTNDISFTVAKDDLLRVRQVMEEKKADIGASGYVADNNVAKVSIVGAGMISNPGVAALMFEALAEEGINIEMISTSEIKVSCVVNIEDAERAVKAVHSWFELDRVTESDLPATGPTP